LVIVLGTVDWAQFRAQTAGFSPVGQEKLKKTRQGDGFFDRCLSRQEQWVKAMGTGIRNGIAW
jgi:hypothetical protein